MKELQPSISMLLTEAAGLCWAQLHPLTYSAPWDTLPFFALGRLADEQLLD